MTIRYASLKDLISVLIQLSDAYSLRHNSIFDDLNSEFYKHYDEINRLYTHWLPPQTSLSEDHIEVFAPSLIRVFEGNPSFSMEEAISSWKREVLHLCLFADKVWLPDPIELIFNILKYSSGQALSVHYSWILALEDLDTFLGLNFATKLLKAVEDVYPLLDAGVISFYPPIKLYTSCVAENLFGELRYFSTHELENSWPDLFVSEGLLFADALNASYAALDFEEYKAISKSVSYLGIDSVNLGLTDSALLAALPKLKLPFFSKMDSNLLVKIRQDEEAFNDFRIILRKFSRELIQGLEDPKFSQTVTQLEKEELEPKIKELAESVSKYKILRESLSEEGIAFAAGAVGWLIAGDPLTSIAGIAGSSLLLTIHKILQNRREANRNFRPAARLVYSFHSGKLKLPRQILSKHKGRTDPFWWNSGGY